jgi:hypothetical protein
VLDLAVCWSGTMSNLHQSKAIGVEIAWRSTAFGRSANPSSPDHQATLVRLENNPARIFWAILCQHRRLRSPTPRIILVIGYGWRLPRVISEPAPSIRRLTSRGGRGVDAR